MFPDTPKTLLKKIAELRAGDDAAEWEAFVELYTPPLRHFVRSVGRELASADVDDAVQEVFVRLVEVLREGRIDREKGRFRAYLAAMARRLLIDRYRSALVRPAVAAEPAALAAGVGAVEALEPGKLFDLRWRLSVHAAAVEQVLTLTALSAQSAAIYEALEGLKPGFGDKTPKEIAEHFGVTVDVVKQVRSRVGRAVRAVEARLLAEE